MLELSLVRLSTVRLHVCLSVLTPSVQHALGIITVLFFICMAALFNPDHRKGERIKWRFVSYTVATSPFVTVQNAIDLNL